MIRYSNIGLVALALISSLASCGEAKPKVVETATLSNKLESPLPPIDCGAFCNPPTVSYQQPEDACSLNSQAVLNCFAWSSFLALNWQASGIRGLPDTTMSATSYGLPGAYAPTVWESFHSIEDLFNGGATPLLKSSGLEKTPLVKQMQQLSKIGSPEAPASSKKSLKAAGGKVDEIMQAKGYWLTDQSGNLVWYEVKINPIEYRFISQNGLYDETKLTAYAQKNQGVWLPQGSIELKAAWRLIPLAKLDSMKAYYKISKAMVPEVLGFDANKEPILGQYTEQYLGLVGLHIIHKTDLAPQFIWMTFEHMHNAPTEGNIDHGIRYSFFDPASKDKPNVSPKPDSSDIHKPVQVVRIAQNEITADIQLLNKQVQQLIKESSPSSVWQNYRLINAQWPANPIADKDNNKKTPLQTGGINPSNISNPTMETYIQAKQCMDCHQNASVPGSGGLPTDYSFVFLRAQKSTKAVSPQQLEQVKKLKQK